MLTQRTTPSAPGASRGRSAEIYNLHTAAGYEAGVREPGCWDHIGRHMRKDAEPVRRTTRHAKPEQPPQPHGTLARVCLVVMLLSLVAAVVHACGAST